jgi:hypothetical protein
MGARSPKDGKSESPKDGTSEKQLSYLRPKYVFSIKVGKREICGTGNLVLRGFKPWVFETLSITQAFDLRIEPSLWYTPSIIPKSTFGLY